MRGLLAFTAVGEAATGLVLLLAPPVIGQLLFGAELTGMAETMARLAGIALLALGVACWPGPPLAGMLTYSVAAALYLAYVGMAGASSGILLWPAVALHTLLAVLLARASRRGAG